MPLEDGSFGAVVSQYGIEYSDMDQSLAEAVRVLAPGGRLRFALHAAEGSVAADTRRAIADADFVLDDCDPFGRASECFQAVLGVELGGASGPLAQTVAQARYAAFRDALKGLADRTATAADAAMLVSVHGSLTDLFEQRRSLDKAAVDARLAELRAEVEAHRERERALLAAALSSEQVAALADRLASLGLVENRISEQRNGSSLIGHILEATKP